MPVGIDNSTQKAAVCLSWRGNNWIGKGTKMKSLLHLTLVTGTLIAPSPPLAASPSEPIRLTDSDLDLVTAGGPSAFVAAAANAAGTPAVTITQASTTVVDRPFVQAAVSFGEAFACCGTGTAAGVQVQVSAEGDAMQRGQVESGAHTPMLPFAQALAWVLAVRFPDDMRMLPSGSVLVPLHLDQARENAYRLNSLRWRSAQSFAAGSLR